MHDAFATVGTFDRRVNGLRSFIVSSKTTDTDTHAAHSALFISAFKASNNREEEEETKR